MMSLYSNSKIKNNEPLVNIYEPNEPKIYLLKCKIILSFNEN
jgi:hypothetical protein